MIYSDSRYAAGNIIAVDTSAGPSIAVLRTFPVDSSTYYLYTWKENDRIDNIAYKLLGSPDLWWRIMDFNPELSNPFSIQLGTEIRIPIG